MTGAEIYKKALNMAGNETDGESLPECAVDEINEIGRDLCDFKEIKCLFDTVEAKKEVTDALPYGIAMLIALKNSDSFKHGMFCELYNAKRAMAKYQSGKRQDTFPYASEGNV